MRERAGRGALRRKLLMASASLALGLGAAEVFIRLTVGAPLAERLPILEVQASEGRGWEMVPGREHYTYHHRVEVNALGLRGNDIGKKQPGETRILALGDSLVYGQGVANDETLPQQLEELLNESPGGTWSVVNGGIRAYDTRQELGLLDELGSVIDPDFVILFWFRNDFIERDIEQTNERLSASGPIAFDIGEPAEGWAAAKWRAKQVLRKSALVMYAHDVVAKEQAARVDELAIDRGLKKLDGYLERLVRTGEEMGFTPLLAIIPVPSLLAASRPDRGPTPQVLAAAERHGVPALDLFDSLRASYHEEGRIPTIPYDGHYDATGNRIMAAAVAEFVFRQ